jgi:hypothetical protein
MAVYTVPKIPDAATKNFPANTNHRIASLCFIDTSSYRDVPDSVDLSSSLDVWLSHI